MLTAARQTAWTLFAAARHLGGLARNLLLLPYAAYRAIRVVAADRSYDPDPEMLREHLHLPLAEDAEDAARQLRTDEIRGLIAQRDWDTLLSRMARWETSRRLTQGRSSFVTETLLAVQALSRPHPGEAPVSSDFIDAFEQAYAARPDNHLMAALLAMAHTGLGWHWRGDGFADDVKPIDEQRFLAHFARAAQVLAEFDAVERYSPGLALAQYQLYAGHPNAEELIEDWFADWADLDSKSINPYMTHGMQLLPRWFGADAGTLDRAALRAASDGADTLGRAGYALLYLGAMEDADAQVLAQCDADLFLDGVRDLLDATPSQHLVNRCAQRLWRASNMQFASPRDRQTARALSTLRARMGDGFRMVVRDYLRFGLPEVWGGEDETLWSVAQAFEAELASGATIRFGENGVEIGLPAA